jgi:hypothetical protein
MRILVVVTFGGLSSLFSSFLAGRRELKTDGAYHNHSGSSTEGDSRGVPFFYYYRERCSFIIYENS